MIPRIEAQRIVDSHAARQQGVERVRSVEAVGRVLAEAPVSDQDLPPFDRITMDGFAVRAADLAEPGSLTVVGEVAAGAVAEVPLEAGQAYRVMTGAPLPPGADSVVMVEQTEEAAGVVDFKVAVRLGQNIHRQAQDLQVGAQPMAVGERITTAHLPLLLTLGCAEVPVIPRPRVSILTSGNELVEPDQRPGPGQIRDSNRRMLEAQVASAGGVARCEPVVRDDREAMTEAVGRALDSDVVLLTGGSSVGAYDFSADAVEAHGARRWFEKVSIKPGKPVLYFTRGETQIFCLPGNPVSAFVTFELLVRPALERRLGIRNVWPQPLHLPCRGELKAPPIRDLFQVASVVAEAGSWWVEPIRWSGSGDLASMARANALIHLPMKGQVGKGASVEVLPLRRVEESMPRAAEPVE